MPIPNISANNYMCPKVKSQTIEVHLHLQNQSTIASERKVFMLQVVVVVVNI